MRPLDRGLSGQDLCPCADGHVQERAWFGAVLEAVDTGDFWITDRKFCTCGFLCGIDTRGACLLVRQHAGVSYESCSPWRSWGRVETGHVAEQPIRVWDAPGTASVCRRLRVKLDQPTRDGGV